MDSSDAGLVVVVGPDVGTTAPIMNAADATADGQASMSDASDAMADAASTCSASELDCNGQCVSMDTDHCGSCTTKCTAPSGAMATCSPTGQAYACGFSCNTNLTHCGSACVDTQSDANNCGRCGHGCVAGGCVLGQCQSWIVTNTSATHAGLQVARAGTFGHVDIATDGTNVVWIDASQGVLQVSATAGASAPVVNLAPMQTSSSVTPADLAMGHGVVAWTLTDVNNGVSLWAATEGKPNSGALVASLGSGSAGDVPSGLALDATGSFAYFHDTENNNASSPKSPGLYKCDLVNKSCSLLYTVEATLQFGLADDVAMANGILFWTDSAGGTISRADYSTNAVGSVVTQEINPTLLATDASNVYWASILVAMIQSPVTPFAFIINRTSLVAPGTVSTVLPKTNGSLQAMGTDGTNFYFSHNTSTATGQLDYVPVDGSAAAMSLKANQTAYGLAVGGGAVYWLNGDNTIDGIAAP